ncbi:hypothetical protein WKK05_24170 [Nostoc sp. UHCC 0302]|uniref:hypothetical protein n=1 Tax=Nostoc sp. UHCC 0302 TaxID=3134896 RepID=UPI00311C9252
MAGKRLAILQRRHYAIALYSNYLRRSPDEFFSFTKAIAFHSTIIQILDVYNKIDVQDKAINHASTNQHHFARRDD